MIVFWNMRRRSRENPGRESSKLEDRCTLHLILHTRHQHLNQMMVMAKLKQRRQRRSRMNPTSKSEEPKILSWRCRRDWKKTPFPLLSNLLLDFPVWLQIWTPCQSRRERIRSHTLVYHPRRSARSLQHPCQKPPQAQKSGLILTTTIDYPPQQRIALECNRDHLQAIGSASKLHRPGKCTTPSRLEKDLVSLVSNFCMSHTLLRTDITLHKRKRLWVWMS